MSQETSKISEFLWQEHNLLSLNTLCLILHVTQGVLWCYCARKFNSHDKKYSFIQRKNALWHKVLFFISVTGNIFPVRNILSFTGKNPFVTDIVLILSQELFFLSHEWFFILLCHNNIFPVRQSNYGFLWHKVYFL